MIDLAGHTEGDDQIFIEGSNGAPPGAAASSAGASAPQGQVTLRQARRMAVDSHPDLSFLTSSREKVRPQLPPY